MDEPARFTTCLPFVLAQECPFPNDWSNAKNFSNDRHDPGGKTMCGIIQREYDFYRKMRGVPTRDVRQITQGEGHEIYLTYWHPHCDVLKPGLDLMFFDTAVNMGTHEAVVLLQRALMINADGIWGKNTDVAVAFIIGPANVTSIIQQFSNNRTFAYKSFKGFPYFGGDWLRRTVEIKAEALRMVQPEAPKPVTQKVDP